MKRLSAVCISAFLLCSAARASIFSATAALFIIATPIGAQTTSLASLSMEAKEVETRVDTQHNWETDYGSYDRDYRKRTAIEVTVRDFSRKSPPATAHIYFIARALKGGPRFIYAQRDLPINFSGQLAVVARVDAPDLKSSVVNFAALGQQYVAGAEMDGWAVVGEVGGKTFQTKASRQPLLDTLLRPGPESMETMLAAYLNATKP